MSAKLTTAVRIKKSAHTMLQSAKALAEAEDISTKRANSDYHVGAVPVLLALSMELALKAWYAFDFNTVDVKRSHNLLELFCSLKSESQNALKAEFTKSVAPSHPNFFYLDFGVEHVLCQHANAFTDWRYIHEPKNIRFEQGVLISTIEMIIREFDKRYVEIDVSPANSLK